MKSLLIVRILVASISSVFLHRILFPCLFASSTLSLTYDQRRVSPYSGDRLVLYQCNMYKSTPAGRFTQRTDLKPHTLIQMSFNLYLSIKMNFMYLLCPQTQRTTVQPPHQDKLYGVTSRQSTPTLVARQVHRDLEEDHSEKLACVVVV